MLSLSTPADDAGIAIISAAARAAVASAGGNGEAAALVLQMVATDAQTRSSGGQDSVGLEFNAEIDGTEVLLSLRDRGEPISGPAHQILPLIELGLMTSAEAQPDGTGNLTELRFARPGHSMLPDTEGVELVAEDAPLSSEEVTIRSLEPSDAASLTRAIYRSYGWTYPHPELYYPERTAAAISSGKRIGEVAVTADGEVVAHWGGVFVTPTIVNSGLALTDPRFRRRGIAKQLMERFRDRIDQAGITGRVGEPVLTHTATQELALQSGGNIVGAFLSYGVPVAQVGITDGMLAGRRSLTEAFFALGTLEPATLWIPTPYLPFVRTVLETASWPRELGDTHRVGEVPEHTLTSTKHDSLNRRGELDVHVIGRDLIDVIDAAMDDLRRAGSEVVHVRLPATDPSLAVLGEGLTELGLAYSALIPGYLDCHDALILQWLADSEVDTSSWHYVNEQVEAFITSILDQVRELSDRGAQSRRRAARRASLFAALDRS